MNFSLQGRRHSCFALLCSAILIKIYLFQFTFLNFLSSLPHSSLKIPPTSISFSFLHTTTHHHHPHHHPYVSKSETRKFLTFSLLHKNKLFFQLNIDMTIVLVNENFFPTTFKTWHTTTCEIILRNFFIPLTTHNRTANTNFFGWKLKSSKKDKY